MKFWEYLKHLTVFGAGEVSDDDGDFLGDIDDDDDGDEGDDEDQDTDDIEDDADEVDEDDDDEDEDFDDESDEDEDDEDEDIESEDDPESEGDGDEEEDGGASALARALKEATRARLQGLKLGEKAEEGINVHIPTVEEIKALDGMDEVDDGDLKVIHGIVAAVVSNAITTYNESAVAPMRTQAHEERRKARVVESYRKFREKYPKVTDSQQTAMAETWDEFSTEFGRDLADEISFEDLYIISGGKGKAAAAKKVKGVAKKLAKDQKRRATRSTRQSGRIGKVSAGGKRGKKRRGDADAAAAVRHIRSSQSDPFTIR